MKKIVVAAMLVMVLAASAPALAQVEQGFGQEAESGDVSQSVEVTNTGDNVNQCAPILQAANTGNLQNAQGSVQHGSTSGDIVFSGSSIEISPELAARCEQEIQQAAATSKTEQPKVEQPKATPPKTEQPKVEEPKAEQPKTEQPKVEQPKATPPKTEQPQVTQPQVEQPKTEQPKTEQPQVEQPKTTQSKVEQPMVAQSEIRQSTSAPKELPRTGGGPLLVLGAGILLIASGVIIRRIIR